MQAPGGGVGGAEGLGSDHGGPRIHDDQGGAGHQGGLGPEGTSGPASASAGVTVPVVQIPYATQPGGQTVVVVSWPGMQLHELYPSGRGAVAGPGGAGRHREPCRERGWDSVRAGGREEGRRGEAGPRAQAGTAWGPGGLRGAGASLGCWAKRGRDGSRLGRGQHGTGLDGTGRNATVSGGPGPVGTASRLNLVPLGTSRWFSHLLWRLKWREDPWLLFRNSRMFTGSSP